MSSQPEPAGSILDRASEHRFARAKPPCTHAQWTQAVGLRVASRAEPLKLERGVLIVKVASSAWAQELGLLGPGIIQRLRAAGVSVTELRFRVGEVRGDVRPIERRMSKKVPPPGPIPANLQRAIDEVTDEELRAVLKQSAAANLAWQSFVGETPVPRRKGR